MKNPQPRFSYDEDNDTIFDNITSQSHPCEGTYEAPDGAWDMAKVKELILAGKPIETAYSGPRDKVEQSAADFIAYEESSEPVPPEESDQGSAEQPKGE